MVNLNVVYARPLATCFLGISLAITALSVIDVSEPADSYYVSLLTNRMNASRNVYGEVVQSKSTLLPKQIRTLTNATDKIDPEMRTAEGRESNLRLMLASDQLQGDYCIRRVRNIDLSTFTSYIIS